MAVFLRSFPFPSSNLQHSCNDPVGHSAEELLGWVVQGDDPLHDTIRERLLETSAHVRVTKSLKVFGADNDEVLWAGLFALATLARDGSKFFQRSCTALAKIGLLPILRRVLVAYHTSIRESGLEEDETIATAGEYLVSVISDALNQVRIGWQKQLIAAVSATAVLVGCTSMLLTRQRR